MRLGANVLRASVFGAGCLVSCQAPPASPPLDSRPAASAAAPLPAKVARPVVPVPTVHSVLADPRLGRVQRAATEHEWSTAAQALAEAEAATPDTRTPEDRCAWAYESGRLWAAAHQPRDAASAYDRAADPTCPLATAATYHAAEAYLRVPDFANAEARARRVDAASSLRDDADLVLATALSGQGRGVEAIPLWRASLQKHPRSWVDVALPLASALLDAPGDVNDNAAEALRLATRIVVEAPRIGESSGAEAIRQRAVARVRGHDPAATLALRVSDRALQAKAWLDAGDGAHAANAARALLADPLVGKEPAAACSTSIVLAQSLAHAKGDAALAWDDAIARCEHDPARVTALFAGAKAVAGKQPELARERYAKVEALFPEHRLADDARFQGALLALAAGDEAAFTKRMVSLPDDYPTGDQRTEALFRVALLQLTRGKWSLAKGFLDRIVALTPDDQHWATAGRAEYFRARVAEAEGQLDDARARYAAVLERHPFAYYMAQAYSRLSRGDPALATRTLAAAFAREEPTSFLGTTHPEFDTPAFQQALRLLEVGDLDLARRELAGAGALKDDVDPEVTWTVALLYDQAGAPELGHAFARQKVRDYLSHYPVGAWRTKWEIAYPRAFDDLVVAGSGTNGIPTALTWAIMREESDFNAEAKSGSNAYGLMQLIVPTAKGVARGLGLPYDEASLKQPRVSVALGTRLLGQLRSTFPDNKALAIAAYNGGGGAVGRWIAARGDEDFDLWVEEIPWDETRGYEKRVLSSEAAYAYLYDPAALDEVLRTPALARGGSRRGRAATSESP